MSTERHLAELNEQCIRSLINDDTAWFDTHLAETFVCVEADGLVHKREQFIRKVAGGAGLVSYRLDDVSIRLSPRSDWCRQLTRMSIRAGRRVSAGTYTFTHARVTHERSFSAQVSRVKRRTKGVGRRSAWRRDTVHEQKATGP
jgi:hypothetical protein